MRGMLNQDAQARPPVKAVVEAGYFQDDRLLRALRFIDTILQRETSQKHAFVRDLPTFLPQIPKRVLRLQVLPCLIQQWQDSALRDAVLPLVLRMVKSLPADIFQDQVCSPRAPSAKPCAPTTAAGASGIMAIQGNAGTSGAQGYSVHCIWRPSHTGPSSSARPAASHAPRSSGGHAHTRHA